MVKVAVSAKALTSRLRFPFTLQDSSPALLFVQVTHHDFTVYLAPTSQDSLQLLVIAGSVSPYNVNILVHHLDQPKNRLLNMKTDNYLNLCLEQAAKSPLRYRHGAIIVRGGKVIGHGHNDYRSGFNGGALKTGRLPLRSSKAELKKKHKHKKATMNDPGQETTKTFTPFEAMSGGGGSLANTPLSMHSEMMAIHAALAACSTELSSAVSSQKLCFKLSGDVRSISLPTAYA